jgi:hypothetical protein
MDQHHDANSPDKNDRDERDPKRDRPEPSRGGIPTPPKPRSGMEIRVPGEGIPEPPPPRKGMEEGRPD